MHQTVVSHCKNICFATRIGLIKITCCFIVIVKLRCFKLLINKKITKLLQTNKNSLKVRDYMEACYTMC